jgi:hypothetical protein
MLVELLLFHIWAPSPCNNVQQASTFLHQSAILLPADKKRAFSELIQAYSTFVQQREEEQRQAAEVEEEDDDEEEDGNDVVSPKNSGGGDRSVRSTANKP